MAVTVAETESPGVRPIDGPTGTDPKVAAGATVSEAIVLVGTAPDDRSSRVAVAKVRKGAAARVAVRAGPTMAGPARIVAGTRGPGGRRPTVDVAVPQTGAVGDAMTVAVAVIGATIDATNATIRRRGATANNAVPGRGTDRRRRNARLAIRASSRRCPRRSPVRNSTGRCGGRCAR